MQSKKNSKKISKITKKDVAETVLKDGLSSPLYELFCIESMRIEKDSYRITLKFLEKLYQKALKIGKKPCLILGFKRDDKETFLLQCFINIKKDGNH